MPASATGTAVTALTLIMLLGCGEREPETTMDGIYTAAQAQHGARLFSQHCARCHSIQEFSGPLFETIWTGAPAASLYLRIANTMPMDQPGSLGTEHVSALVAHILAVNGMPTGQTPLSGDPEWLAGILITRPEQGRH